MARVKQKVARKGGGGASTRGGQVAKQKNKHRIVLGDNTKEKKIPTVITFRADPPPGYTFIPAGNPELTSALKEFARTGDHKIYAVTTTPHATRHELSREVHRIGFHFPTSVVAQVCSHYGIRLTRGGKVIDDSNDDQLFTNLYQNGEREQKEKKDQVTINTDAKQIIKDLFPKIPDKDLFQIIKTAFQLGDRKVGTAEEIPLVRRAQLSVVAHVRHIYTQYDKLLRTLPYNEARHSVEKDTLMKLIEWRGDENTVDEATQRAADELLREVIVISDEEDSESDSEGDGAQPIEQNHIQVEELPSNSYGRAPGSGLHVSPTYGYQHEDIGPAYHVPRLIRSYKPTDVEIAQRDRSRYAVWNQAKQDYRSSIAQKPTTVLERIYEREPVSASRILVPLDQPGYPTTHVVRSQAPPTPMSRVDYEPHPARRASPPAYIRDANGRLFERVETRPRETLQEVMTPRHHEIDPMAMQPGIERVRTRPSSPQPLTWRDSRRAAHVEGGDGTILPSIEGPDGSYMSPQSRRNPFDRRSEPRDTNLGREDRHLRQLAFVDLTGSNESTPKRRRVEEGLPPLDYRPVRRESPDEYRERVLVPQPSLRSSHVESRISEFEPRSSPRMRPGAIAPETRYVDRHPTREVRDLSHIGQRYHQPVPATHDNRETATTQSRYYAQNYPTINRGDFEAIIPTREPGVPSLIPVSRVHEPVVEPRGYDPRNGREHDVVVREQYEQPVGQESRARYLYPAGSDVREPVERLPPQHAYEYEYRQPPPSRSYVR